MTLTLPDTFAATQSAEWHALHLALGLYVSKEATLGQAAEVAGMSQAEFQRELGKRKIPINYTLEDFEDDMRTIGAMTAR